MIAFIDYRTTVFERSSLKKLGIDYIDIPQCKQLYEAIDGHVDIQMNILSKSKRKIIVHQDIPDTFLEKLKINNINYIKSDSKLQSTYPNNVSLNAAILDNYLIHNLKYTDKNILENIPDKKLINIKQGYAKCSILPVREKAIITNDKGIYNSLSKENFDILLLPPGDILLPNLNYGFIGGVGGKISDDSLAFFGNLDFYLYGNEIKRFLSKYDITPIYLSNGKLVDRGSLLTL